MMTSESLQPFCINVCTGLSNFFQRLHSCLSPSNIICYCFLLPSLTEFCHHVIIDLPLDDVPFWYFQNSVTFRARVGYFRWICEDFSKQAYLTLHSLVKFYGVGYVFLAATATGCSVMRKNMDICKLVYEAIKRTWISKYIRLCNNHIRLICF